MSYTQLITPNYNIPYVGGLCEGFSEGTVGQASLPTPQNPMTYGVWNNAVHPVNPGETGAWDQNYGNGNHPNELPPPGLRVPVFFELGSTPAGHVALMLEDGRVACSAQAGYHSTPYIYPNLDALIEDYAKANGGCTYLGWSEYIGKLKIVGEDTMLILDNKDWRDRANKSYQRLWGWDISDEAFQAYVGKDFGQLIIDLEDGVPSNNWYDFGLTGQRDVTEQIRPQLTAANQKIAELEAAQPAPQVPTSDPIPAPAPSSNPFTVIWQSIKNIFKKG